MAQTTQRQTTSPIASSAPLVLSKARRPLLLRRLLAWSLEVGLLVGSAALPWYGGDLVRRHVDGPSVPVSPAVVAGQNAIARTLGLPKPTPLAAVPPLTNLLWFSALGLPLVVVGSQLYWLSTAGKTLPKHCLGLRIITLEGTPPGLLTILRRELIGRWGLPVLAAYGLWMGSGAFPQVGLLGSLALLALAAEGATLCLNRTHRAFHDRIAGTLVVPGRGVYLPVKYYPLRSNRFSAATYEPSPAPYSADVQSNTDLTLAEEAGGLTSVIWVPPDNPQARVPRWLHQHPSLVLGGVVLGGLSILMVGIVGTQLYTQQQVSQRSSRQQNDDLFLALVETLSNKANTPAEQQAAILALASSHDPRAVPLLVDLLGQTSNPVVLDALQQALVTAGTSALPPLRQLNQTLASDQVLLAGEQRLLAQQRQQTVKRTVANILATRSGQLAAANLSNTYLGQVAEGPDAFTLVLDHLDMAGVIWQGAVLSGANFRQSRFFAAGKDGRPDTYDDQIADLSGSDLTEADFSQSQLRYVKFQGSSLLRADLSGSQATRADFFKANLSSARLINAVLNRANFEEATLVGADLTDSQLEGAALMRARLRQAQAAGANLTGANLTQLEGQQVNFSNANLSRANLSQADLSEGQFQGTNLSRANLSGANLKNSNLSGANLRGANMAGADFQGALLLQPKAQPANSFIEAVPELPHQGFLTEVDFSEAKNLSAEQIAYICAQGGIHPSCSDGKR